MKVVGEHQEVIGVDVKVNIGLYRIIIPPNSYGTPNKKNTKFSNEKDLLQI